MIAPETGVTAEPGGRKSLDDDLQGFDRRAILDARDTDDGLVVGDCVSDDDADEPKNTQDEPSTQARPLSTVVGEIDHRTRLQPETH
ncbi:hypothetical protein [Halorubrum luteum]